MAELRWTRATTSRGCIDEAQLARAIERHLGRRVFSEDPEVHPSIVIDARVQRLEDGNGWFAEIDARTVEGEPLGHRNLVHRGPNCRTFDEALVLIVSLTIEANMRSGARARKAPAKPSPWRVEASLGALGGAGVMPKPSAGLWTAAALRPPRWPTIELGSALWFEQKDTEHGVGTRAFLWTVGPSLCPRVMSKGRVALSMCVGTQVGQLWIEGVGFDRVHSRVWVLAYGGWAWRLDVRLARLLAARVSLAAWLPFVRPRFYSEDSRETKVEVYQPHPVGGVLTIGFVFAFDS